MKNGFSIVEYLVALLISVIVLMIMVATFSYSIKYSTEVYNLVRDTEINSNAAINLWQRGDTSNYTLKNDVFDDIALIDAQIASDLQNSLNIYQIDPLYGSHMTKIYVEPTQWK